MLLCNYKHAPARRAQPRSLADPFRDVVDTARLARTTLLHRSTGAGCGPVHGKKCSALAGQRGVKTP